MKLAKSILFVLGPSGAGKSSLGDALAGHGFVHLEHDIYPESGDGIDVLGLREVWDAFLEGGWTQPLIDELLLRAVRGRGVVLTFSGIVVLPTERLLLARDRGIAAVILYGTAADCLNAFLERERHTGRGLTLQHWVANNRQSYIAFSLPDLEPFRLPVFDSRGRRVDLVAAVLERLAPEGR